MKNRKLVKPVFRLTAAALAVSLMFGCGGGSSDTSPAPIGQTAPVSAPSAAVQSVSVAETATMMSVTADVRTAGKPMLYEAQSLQYTFAAQVEAGPNKGVALTGLLTLKGEREDDGYTEVEGRLFPDESPTLPPPAEDLKEKFKTERKELKAALRADIKALSEELKLALANGAVPDSSGLSAAQREALALFKTKFRERMAEYRAALSALVAEYRAACDSRRPRGDDDDEDDERAAKGFEVHGRIEPGGVIMLTIDLGDRGKIRATGLVDANGSVKGTLTGPADGDTGTWTASATVDSPTPPTPTTPTPTPTPPPTPTPTPTPPPVPTPTPSPPAGPSAANGKVLYGPSCAMCHGANPADNRAKVLVGASNPTAIANAIAKGTGGMGFLKLTSAELADIAAYLATPNI